MKFAKNSIQGLKMRTVQLAHPETGHRIEIVGVTHVAVQEYWDSIKRLLRAKEAAGYVVHLEGLLEPTREPNEDEAKKLGYLDGILTLSTKLAYHLNLVHQKASSHTTNSMKRIDMDRLTLVNEMDAEKLEVVGEIVSRESASRNNPRLMLWVLRNIGWLSNLINSVPAFNILDTAVIIDRRNEFATSHAMQEKQNVVLLWGAAHIPGMVSILKASGYRLAPAFDGQEDIEWRLAIPRSHKAPRYRLKHTKQEAAARL